ncbi:uncharacterized protein MYCFIDRAFT_177725 [Pseudocercospora fijiensis CIRAD86]|uniref:Uncharacterized protein n=1 Tax=Pseudocercospora fijiensis (strain CIRAD86) TaxID=383855 RepID=M2ZIW5_PSEFD|nr:uncharacterized protein MYCFIDRAFT_177725 [Pseudocercospora fijiensis CIRAD86]EME79054.1 hypothetical protein MYCFIDRAFT_177725 [Pseudocercospora fijiensis CIRAD86]
MRFELGRTFVPILPSLIKSCIRHQAASQLSDGMDGSLGVCGELYHCWGQLVLLTAMYVCNECSRLRSLITEVEGENIDNRVDESSAAQQEMPPILVVGTGYAAVRLPARIPCSVVLPCLDFFAYNLATHSSPYRNRGRTVAYFPATEGLYERVATCSLLRVYLVEGSASVHSSSTNLRSWLAGSRCQKAPLTIETNSP